MHPSLEPSESNFAKLPPPIRVLRTKVAKGTLAKEDLIRLSNGPFTRLPPTLYRYTLSIFYSALDPVSIPILQNLEHLEAAVARDVLFRVLLAMRCLAVVEQSASEAVLESVMVDLWPRVWAWIQFIDTFLEHLVASVPREVLIGDCLAVLQSFLSSSLPATQIPAVMKFIGRAWTTLAQDAPGSPLVEVAKILLSANLSTSPESLARVKQISLGAGGYTELGRLIVTYIRRIVPSHDTVLQPYDLSQLEALGGLFSFIPDRIEALRDSLWENGLIPALTIVTRALGKQFSPWFGPPISPEFGYLHARVFIAILDGFVTPGWHVRVKDSLQAGLLDAVIRFCQVASEEQIKDNVVPLLEDYLPASMVFLSVLRQLRPVIEWAATVIPAGGNGPELTHQVLVPLWEKMIALGQSRLELVERYDAHEVTGLRGCSYPECGKILGKLLLKRCGGCQRQFYCSKKCQKSDWGSGHRQACSQQHTATELTDLTKTDQSFLRALMNHEAAQLRMKEDVAMSLLKLLYANPDDSPFVALDYSTGHCVASMGSKEQLRCPAHRGCEGDKLIAHEINRTVRSSGRMQIRFIKLRDDENTRDRGVQMVHFEQPMLYQGVLKLAMSLRAKFPNGDVDFVSYSGAIQKIAALSHGIVQTH
ncbi:hypothetical protein C8F01DRAFT_1237652 [Mycena amicta]|nr:hypothetical protein C8F01DRAFT_1237652 [Mycena amicta]